MHPVSQECILKELFQVCFWTFQEENQHGSHKGGNGRNQEGGIKPEVMILEISDNGGEGYRTGAEAQHDKPVVDTHSLGPVIICGERRKNTQQAAEGKSDETDQHQHEIGRCGIHKQNGHADNQHEGNQGVFSADFI